MIIIILQKSLYLFFLQEYTTDVVIKGVPTIEDLGVKPIVVDAQLPWEIKPFRFDGSYEPALREYQDIIPPKPVENKC